MNTLKKGGDVIPLYADIATQLGATVIRDVQGTDAKDITRALTPDRVQPGLNFVHGQHRGARPPGGFIMAFPPEDTRRRTRSARSTTS